MKTLNTFFEFSTQNTLYRFLPTGDIFSFTSHNIMLNQFRGNPLDGSINNIYLRIYNSDKIEFYPLLGIKSHSTLSKGENTLVYQGTIDSIRYTLTFYGTDELWFWDIALTGTGQTIDLVYGQDIAIASAGAVLTNELYVSQYIDHKIFNSNHGYIVCSRQNQPQGATFPYLQQGSLGIKTTHYSTDGMQFFGLSYKSTQTPSALTGNLQDFNYQYEFAYTALQTEKFQLDHPRTFAFYGLFKENHPTPIETLEFTDYIETTYHTIKQPEAISSCPSIVLKPCFSTPYVSPKFSEKEIFNLFPDHKLEEYKDEQLLSFFTSEASHIVTQDKELISERPHGTIITTKIDLHRINNELITSTNYMYGQFNGQTVVGNTSFHKFLSTPRGLLNIQKTCGQHIYIKLDDYYHLLTLPALYEMGMNYSKWFYILPNDLLIITSFAAADEADIVLEVHSQKGKNYDFIITNQLVLGENEFTDDITYSTITNGLRFELNSNTYSGIHYDLQLSTSDFEISDDRIFFTNDCTYNGTLLTITTKNQSHFQCIIRGRLNSALPLPIPNYTFNEEASKYQLFFQHLMGGFKLESTSSHYSKQLDILNTTLWWYSHNALVHFAVPHGLEQPGGAAWGTRDICQGPLEYFLATQHFDLVKEILFNIFSHQDCCTGEWPQWFMFDRYPYNAGECHGDVVFWPLKAVTDYIHQTGDLEILNQVLPYANDADIPETLFKHIQHAVAAIQSRFIDDTGLITYAGGDWDDTLQPVNDTLKKQLVSSWTVALGYQTLSHLSTVISKVDLEYAHLVKANADKIHYAFNHLLIKDDVISGFVRCNNGYQYMLHPSDDTTGIHYRLLPMTRSIIAELVSPEQAEHNYNVIEENLKCPDGIRLMDHPATYAGGVSKLFKRAEQASNVGREISLQYTHAHIRYIEAMAKLGKCNDAWDGLFTINPILIQESVPNACIRQSNLYFSSSEGAYNDRYEYAKSFNKLKEGSIDVKGGWRLYSSGPGIYINQLITNLLGIKSCPEGLIIDPVLPSSLDGLKCSFRCKGYDFTFYYHFTSTNHLYITDGSKKLTTISIENIYRPSGVMLSNNTLSDCDNILHIFIPLNA